jgi:hypothetical protein
LEIAGCRNFSATSRAASAPPPPVPTSALNKKSAELLLRALSCRPGPGSQFQWLPRAR